MALTLGQGAQFVASVGYAARTRAAMVRAALAVAAESIGSLTPIQWLKRRQLSTRILANPDAFLASFLASVAADPASSLTWYPPLSVASSTNANPSVITTSAAHGLTSGDVVEIADHLVNTAANGVWVVTVLTTTTFSIPQAANGTGSGSGTVMRMIIDSDLAFTVNSVFSANANILPGD